MESIRRRAEGTRRRMMGSTKSFKEDDSRNEVNRRQMEQTKGGLSAHAFSRVAYSRWMGLGLRPKYANR
jgi:hypothetical protein